MTTVTTVTTATTAAQAATASCANCRASIRWIYDPKARTKVAFDAEPHPQGSHVINPTTGNALEIPLYLYHQRKWPDTRWVVHRRTCGVGPGPMRLVSSLERMARGDNRRSRQSTGSVASNPGEPLQPNGECRSCGAPIAWVTTQDGQNVPVDLKPIGAGLVTVHTRNGRRYEGRVEGFGPKATGIPRYQNHHLGCTAPPKHR